MNAKIELQNLITEKISNSTDDTEILKWKDLWHAVEEAIFNVPDKEKIKKEAERYAMNIDAVIGDEYGHDKCVFDFISGCNYILDYKLETDEVDIK